MTAIRGIEIFIGRIVVIESFKHQVKDKPTGFRKSGV